MPTKDEKILEEMKKRFAESEDAEDENRQLWLEDMRFAHVPGTQWPENVRKDRENPTSPRPCLEINITAQHVYQVTNDIRQNRPTIKVRATSMDADDGVAGVFDGTIRHIDACSDADTATDVAANGQVTGGFGYFRIVTEYLNGKDGEQEIYIKPVYNALSVRLDPHGMCPVGSDVRWGFIEDTMAKDVFEKKYGKVDNAVGIGDAASGWVTRNDVRIVEYFAIEEESKNMLTVAQDDGTEAEMPEGEYWDANAGEEARPEIKDAREDKNEVVIWRKCTAFKILETTTFPSKYIPIIRVPGLVTDVEGKRRYKGLVRDAKDPQRVYNYEWSLHIETGALQPKIPYLVAEGQIAGYENDWKRANTANLPYLQYRQTDLQGRPAPAPQRQQLQNVGQGTLQGLQMANDAIKMVTGQYEASLGQKSNETSGRAIVARQREGDTATYHYVDNLSMAIRHKGRILIDMIPRVYNKAKLMRIVGEDGTSREARIDPSQKEPVREAQDSKGKINKIYNLSVGTYDVVATVGPTYATKRQEAVDAMSQILQGNPQLFQIIGDIFVRNQDWPGADEMAKRLKIMLPPQIQQAEASEEGEGQEVPPQVQQQMQQMQQQMQQMQQALQEAQMQNQQLEQQVKGKQADMQMKQVDFQMKQIDAQVKMQELQVKQQEVIVQGQQAQNDAHELALGHINSLSTANAAV